MSINIDTQDIVQYPGNIKRVTVDVAKLVPAGFEGDEQFALTLDTSAYSDNANSTAIQSIYIMDFIVGWAKSSGLTGSAGKYMLDSTHNTLGIKMDATVSGSDGSGYYQITLDYNSSTPKSGEDIAIDMEEKIRAIQCVPADAGYQLAYTNATVEYKESKFWIMSGSISESFTGAYRSSVAVSSGITNDCSGILGFSTPVTTSEMLAGTSVSEALITSDYTADSPTLHIGTGTGVLAGDVCMITDGTNTDYFSVVSVSGSSLTVPNSSTNGFTGITNNYSVADYAKVQILRYQDPDAIPSSYITSTDEAVKYGLKSMINQIDYSS